MTTRRAPVWIVLILTVWVTGAAFAQSNSPPRSAEISNVEYTVTYNTTTAPFRQMSITMSFQTSGTDPVILSLPAWTPGSYELDNYARNVRNFAAHAEGAEARWEKVDWDTWRVFSTGSGTVSVSFDYRADNLDTGSSWSAADFVFFNGTNVFLYPEGRSLDFPSKVKIETEPDWKVATGMTAGSSHHEYVAADFHELVDMPTFVGRFDVDSVEIDGVMHRLATYPEGFLAGDPRDETWRQLKGMMAPMAAVFGETPFETYTTLMAFPEEYGGASALEHRNSHLGIYVQQLAGSAVTGSVLAHEIFHAWNVKRLRPAEMVPYDYGQPQPTTLLWVSEGITSYYDDLALVRGGVVDRDHFYSFSNGDVASVENAGAVALEDASLSSWIGVRDGTGGIYYPKGAMAGFLLDILIRDATDNRASLDDVMRNLYERTYRRDFTGFTEIDWWGEVHRVSGVSFEDFYSRYVDGREEYPWDEVLPLAALMIETDTTVRPLVGIYPEVDSTGVRVTGLTDDGAAAEAGMLEGDYLLSAGPVQIVNNDSFDEFRAHFAEVPEGTMYDVVVRRGGEEVTLQVELRLSTDISRSLVEHPTPSEKAVRIRESLLQGEPLEPTR
jgi:predicted metalloprotease with PDZ domain